MCIVNVSRSIWFQVLTAVTVTEHTLVEIYKRCGYAICRHFQTLEWRRYISPKYKRVLFQSARCHHPIYSFS